MAESSSISSSSTSRKKVLKGVTLLFFILLASFGALWHLNQRYDEVAGKNEYNAYSDKRFSDFYDMEKNTVDMVFVGSSHAYCSFDPENFDGSLGISSFQLGMPLQRPDATYYTLKEVYRYQTPGVVVMEVYWNLLTGASDIRQAKTLFQSLKNPELEAEYLEQVFPLSEKIRYRIPLFNYQSDFFAFKSKEILEFFEENQGVSPAKEDGQNEYYKARGYVFCDSTMAPDEFGRTNQFNGSNGKAYEMDEDQISYMRKIAGLCRENGSQLILVTAPIANTSLERIKNYDLIHKQVVNLTNSLSVPYIDYNEMIDMFNNNNFRDDAHLNDSGVKLLNKHFLEFLSESGHF